MIKNHPILFGLIKRIHFLLLFQLSFCLISQESLKYEDQTYLDHIKSVKFHHSGLYTSAPIVDLNSGGKIVLSFDDIYGGDRNYRYKIIHCDKDWNPSGLDEMEYLNGFNDEDIQDYSYSIGTKLDYTHYRLSLPNRDVSWRISGNYLLVVHDDDSDELAITRRFMVVEPKVSVIGKINKSIKAFQSRTHQEIDFTINYKNFQISNPQREVYVRILQNGRWDNEIKNLQPRVIFGQNLEFRNSEEISFPGYNEFRGVDIRSIRNKGFGVHSIDVFPDGYHILLQLDRKRNNLVSLDYNDLNGNYIIENLDDDDLPDVRSEYIDVQFVLDSRDPFPDMGVCVVGSFSDWQCNEENLMKYDHTNQVYYTSILLKQGYYDYQYVLKDGNTLDFEYFEGSKFFTRNEYHVLVYLRTYSERYDRLIAVRSIKSDF